MESGVRTLAGSTSEPIVLRRLFDDEVHQRIIDFLDQRIPFLSLGVPLNIDETDFVRHYAHNVPFFVAIHQQLTDLASEIFGEPLKPSYSFLSMYQDNGTCPLHIDRPQCYRTIDYLIRQTQQESWPILIGDQMTDDQRKEIDESSDGHPDTAEKINARISAENWHRIDLAPNDAVCYSGTHSWHYRPERLKGTADLVFWHFVPLDFDGPLG